MDIEKEFDRITAPAGGASKVRRLTRDEIEELAQSGKVTPVEQIPQYHCCGREVFPLRWGRGIYFK